MARYLYTSKSFAVETSHSLMQLKQVQLFYEKEWDKSYDKLFENLQFSHYFIFHVKYILQQVKS